MQRTRRAAGEGSIHSRAPSGRPRKDNEEIENLAVMRPRYLKGAARDDAIMAALAHRTGQRVALSLDPFLFAIRFVHSLAFSPEFDQISTRVHCVSLILFRFEQITVCLYIILHSK